MIDCINHKVTTSLENESKEFYTKTNMLYQCMNVDWDVECKRFEWYSQVTVS